MSVSSACLSVCLFAFCLTVCVRLSVYVFLSVIIQQGGSLHLLWIVVLRPLLKDVPEMGLRSQC